MKLLLRLFFKSIRAIIGPVMLFVDKITTPRGINRPEKDQENVDAATKNLTLYQFKTCPFCIKVRRAKTRLSLNIEIRDAQHNPSYRQELQTGGGEIKVPCLKIIDDDGKIHWMYESQQIIEYLNNRFAA